MSFRTALGEESAVSEEMQITPTLNSILFGAVAVGIIRVYARQSAAKKLIF